MAYVGKNAVVVVMPQDAGRVAGQVLLVPGQKEQGHFELRGLGQRQPLVLGQEAV